GEGGGVRRVAVDDGVDVRPVLVHRQVQQDLAAALARARQLLALVIDLAQVVGPHEALRDHRRRTQDPAVVEADPEVVSGCRGEALGVDAPADLADLLFELVFIHRRSSCSAQGRWRARPPGSMGRWAGTGLRGAPFRWRPAGRLWRRPRAGPPGRGS